MVFPTQYTESVREGSKQYFSKPSMTEPDNAMSIPEIIARFTRGQGLQVQQHPWQAGSASEDDGFNPGETDINEFMELREQPNLKHALDPEGTLKPALDPEATLKPALDPEGTLANAPAGA